MKKKLSCITTLLIAVMVVCSLLIIKPCEDPPSVGMCCSANSTSTLC